jgi:hypothetical protein
VNERDISEALCRSIVDAMPTRCFVLENRDSLPAKPYVALEVVRVSKTDDTLRGGHTRALGFVQATVVTDRGAFDSEALCLADEVERALPYGTRITITGATITILKPPFTGQGFPDGPDWRVPVRIDYEAQEPA